MNKEIISRLKYVEETYAGETETWLDPVTGHYWHVSITLVRDWENAMDINDPNS